MSEELKAAHEPCNWDDAQVLEFLGVALRNVDLVGSVRLSEIRQGFEHMRKLYAAPVVSAEQQGGADKTDYKRKFECLVDHCKRQDMVIADMRYDANIRRFYDDSAVWFWAGDETDNLETLACPVVINAGDLRAMLAAAPAAPAADALYEAVTPDVVEWLRCGLAANNRLVDGTHPALERVREAIAAHRAKGVV